MNKQEVFEIIKKDYPEARWISSSCIQIDFMDVMIDPYNLGYVDILFTDDRIILTDFANNYPLLEFEEEECIAICKKHGLVFNNYNIECIYNTNDDIKRYKECIEEFGELNIKRKY